jgi:hypothetical protein
VISTKCSAPWVLEFVVSSIIGDSQWENCISLDINFQSNFIYKQNQQLAVLVYANKL